MKEMPLKIDYLKNHPNAIETLAKIWREELGKIWCPEVSLEQVKLKFEQHCHRTELPIAKLVLDNDIPIGMGCLRITDGIRDDLTPWLGGLVVTKAFQGKGIGKLLIDSIKVEAKNLGFSEMYLLTFNPTLPRYYNRLGWEELEKNTYSHKPVTIMKTVL